MNNIQKNPSERLMFMDALHDLQAGCVNAIDKEILSYSPLPDNFTDPYLSQQVESNDVMDLTYKSLSNWIEEAKKASYFTKHFVTLSRMINNGVATMARGLVTLHLNGGDLSLAPMSVDDLIGVGSYQFRKSYLGVIQTSARNPEIGERLLLNQLSWANTLLRLYKTKDKLAEKPVIKEQNRDKKLLAGRNGVTCETPSISEGISDFDSLLPAGDVQGISELSALSEPGAFSAVRAYNGFSSPGKRTSAGGNLRSGKSLDPVYQEVSIQNEAPEVSSDAAAEPAQQNCTYNAVPDTEQLHPDKNTDAKAKQEKTDTGKTDTIFEKEAGSPDSGTDKADLHDASVIPDPEDKREKPAEILPNETMKNDDQAVSDNSPSELQENQTNKNTTGRNTDKINKGISGSIPGNAVPPRSSFLRRSNCFVVGRPP